MLNSTTEVLVNLTNIEIIFWNVCIECLENVKSYFIILFGLIYKQQKKKSQI
jgi:hypothetical protein